MLQRQGNFPQVEAQVAVVVQFLDNPRRDQQFGRVAIHHAQLPKQRIAKPQVRGGLVRGAGKANTQGRVRHLSGPAIALELLRLRAFQLQERVGLDLRLHECLQLVRRQPQQADCLSQVLGHCQLLGLPNF